MASLFKEIFLSKKDKQIIGIYNTINDYWKNTNDFTAAHIRYLQDLNHKHNLGFTEELINDLPIIILTPLINNRFSQSNAMYIFSQFVGLYIFRMGDPAIYRYSNDNLLNIAEKVTGLLIPFRSRLYPHLKYQLNKDIDVIEKFGNIDEVNAKKAKCIQNENNRILIEEF